MLPIKNSNTRNSVLPRVSGNHPGLTPDSRKCAAMIFCSALFVLATMTVHGEVIDKPDPEE